MKFKIKLFSATLALLVLGNVTAFAQENFDNREFFVGYTYNVEMPYSGGGMTTSATFNVHKYVGLKGQFGFSSGGGDSALHYMGGLQFRDNRENRRSLRAFGHVLAGAQTWKVQDGSYFIDVDPEDNAKLSRTGLSIALGGGLDREVSERIAIRFQGDVSRVWFSGNSYDETRLSLGLVFR